MISSGGQSRVRGMQAFRLSSGYCTVQAVHLQTSKVSAFQKFQLYTTKMWMDSGSDKVKFELRKKN